MKKSFVKKDFVLGTVVPRPLHELLIDAACAVFETTYEDLFSDSRSREHAQRRAILFYILRYDLDYPDADIAKIGGCSRQRVSDAVSQVDFEIRNYLRISCMVKNIRAVYANLRKEQELWLSQHLPKSNITRLTPPSPKDP